MTRSELLAFFRDHRLCVQSTNSSSGPPQSAVVGFAVTDSLELIFDTLSTTRKVANLRRDPRMSVVVGWDSERSAQLEGVADEPQGLELARVQQAYFAVWPDGVARAGWKGITCVRMRIEWARYSDFGPGGKIVEVDLR